MKATYTLTAALASLASAQVYSGPLYVYGDSTTTEVNNLQVFSNGGMKVSWTLPTKLVNIC